jgi:hypothetical protein
MRKSAGAPLPRESVTVKFPPRDSALSRLASRSLTVAPNNMGLRRAMSRNTIPRLAQSLIILSGYGHNISTGTLPRIFSAALDTGKSPPVELYAFQFAVNTQFIAAHRRKRQIGTKEARGPVARGYRYKAVGVLYEPSVPLDIHVPAAGHGHFRYASGELIWEVKQFQNAHFRRRARPSLPAQNAAPPSFSCVFILYG